ncbi:MAG: hypothetical protein J5I91_08965 [Bacteroidetes bacterium]|nr:hypothetical protein [Bacteroidota bacterium]
MKEAKIVLKITKGVVWFVFLSSMVLMLLPVSIKAKFFDSIPYISLVLIALVFAAFSIGKFYAKTLNTTFEITDFFTKRFNIPYEKMRWVVIGNTLFGVIVLIVVGVFFIKRFL